MALHQLLTLSVLALKAHVARGLSLLVKRGGIAWNGRLGAKHTYRAVGAFLWLKRSASNLALMVHLRMIQHLHHGMHSPSFGVVCTVYQAPDAGMHYGAGAHRTRFNCNKQIAVSQPVVA